MVALAWVMELVPGNYMEVQFKTFGLFTAPLAGLFVMALFIPSATSIGTMVGALFGFCTAILISFWDVITGGPPLSFLWIIPFSLVVQIIVGIIVGVLIPRRRCTADA